MLVATQASSSCSDEVAAVDEIAEAIGGGDRGAVVFFCSARYDLDRFARRMQDRFGGVVVGCTSAGQIGRRGYVRAGVSAVRLEAPELEVTPFLIAPLSAYDERVAQIAAQINGARDAATCGGRSFGFTLVDGLSMAEERLSAAVYRSLGDVPIVGGSAGDDLRFERTFVYHEGRFVTGAALFVHVRTALPFATIKLAHFVPTATKLVITQADPGQRLVREIDGLPAAEAFAELVGADARTLDAVTFARHPLMLKIAGEYYVRSIQRVNADGSLTFFCAVEDGLVLTVGEGTDPLEAMERAFAAAARRVGPPEIVLGCDCILRRLSFEQSGLDARVGRLLAKNRVVGFGSYGEQWNAIHLNQTFTGVAIGRGEP